MSNINVFSAQDVFKTFNDAYQKAINDGKLVEDSDDSELANYNWWNSVITWKSIFDVKPSKGEHPVIYQNNTYKNHDGRQGRLIIQSFDEINKSSIAPIDDEEVARINEENAANKRELIKNRGKNKPTIFITKYKVSPKYEKIDDVDEDGEPYKKIVVTETPSEEHESILYKAIELYNKAYLGEIKSYMDKGWIIQAGGQKPKGKKGFKPVVVPSLKLFSMVHDTYAHTNKSTPGQPIPNPSAKLQLRHDYAKDCFDDPNDKKTGLLMRKTRIYDKDTQQLAKIDGQLVKNSNVHKFIKYGCIMDLCLDLGAIAYSSQGISNPAIILGVGVKQPKARSSEITIFDSIFGIDRSSDTEGNGNNNSGDEEEKSDNGSGNESGNEEDKLIEDIANM
jgi:hypothetical protein